MNRLWQLGSLILGTTLLSACFSLSDKTESSPLSTDISAAKQIAQQKKDSIQSVRPNASLPDMLGGILSSDRWTVYQEKQQEEFEGHVRYDNEQYIFRADYALSERKQNRLTAKGNVYVRHNEPNNVWYELHAPYVVYNYGTGRGYAQAPKKKTVQLVYHTEKGDLITAYARRAEIDTKQQTYVLIGDAQIVHVDPQQQIATLKADRISARQKDQYALLKGHAYAQRDGYEFYSDAIEYDGLAQQAYAYGDRPLAQGAIPDGTFAIIADKVTAQTDSHKIHLEGAVQGWVVSEQINQSKANKAF